MMHQIKQSEKEGNDQELTQSSTTPDPGYQWEIYNVTIRHHKRELRGQPFTNLNLIYKHFLSCIILGKYNSNFGTKYNPY